MRASRSSSIPTGTLLLCLCIVGGLLLSGCQTVEERQGNILGVVEDVTETASGTVHTAVESIDGILSVGKIIYGALQSGVAEVEERVDSVTEGVQMIQEGKKKIEEGLGTAEDDAVEE